MLVRFGKALINTDFITDAIELDNGSLKLYLLNKTKTVLYNITLNEFMILLKEQSSDPVNKKIMEGPRTQRFDAMIWEDEE